jgi:hypothetical protein
MALTYEDGGAVFLLQTRGGICLACGLVLSGGE